MSHNGTSAIHVAQGSAGFLVRVEGWGTMRESPLLQEFAWECLDGNASPLVVDLSACEYLDSTFLGCLVGLHRHFGRGSSPRFVVAAGPQQRQRLLAPLQLHRVLKLIDEAPQPSGDWLALCTGRGPPASDPKQLGQHLLECHRRLAELGGTNEVVFSPIVEQLARDLREDERRGDAPLPRQPSGARR
jgi:anti-anti-sigma regulatory factor